MHFKNKKITIGTHNMDIFFLNIVLRNIKSPVSMDATLPHISTPRQRCTSHAI